MRRNFGAKPWFYPLPVLIVGTYYNSKKLELALPDMPMTAEQAEVINWFIKNHKISVVIVQG